MNKKQGFTLIELLVVVLIIGILSSVAVPQYTKAVAKARVVEAITALKSLTEAQEVFFLANMRYTDNLDELDVEIHNPGKYYRYECEPRTCWAFPLRNGDPTIEFHMKQKVRENTERYLGKHWCQTNAKYTPNPEKAREICRSFGPEDPEMGGYYLIQ